MCTIICVYNHLTDRITRRDIFHEPVYTLLLPTILELHASLDVDLYNWQQTCLRYGPAGCMSWRHLMPRFRITWQGKKHRLPLYIFLFLKEREAAANRRISWYTGNDIKKRDGGKLMVLIMLCGALPENDISCLTFDAFLSLIYSSLVCHLYFPLSVFLSLPSGLTQKIVDAAFLYTWIIYIHKKKKYIDWQMASWQYSSIRLLQKRTHKCYRKIDKQRHTHTHVHTSIHTRAYAQTIINTWTHIHKQVQHACECIHRRTYSRANAVHIDGEESFIYRPAGKGIAV